jgi:glutamate-1-semialdehyde 2,1-aminomutase
VAGTTCLKLVSNPDVQAHCDAMAARLRAGFNRVLVERGVSGVCYGESSVFHVALGMECGNLTAGDIRLPEGLTPAQLKAGMSAKVKTSFVSGLMLEGSDITFAGGWLSTAHAPADIDKTIDGFDRTIARMRDEGIV